jgi:uncharacterized protein with ATP-grasp and redox domains
LIGGLLIAKIDCIPCILDDVRGALELLTPDERIKRQVMRESLEFLARNISLEKEPSIYITEIHRILKRVCGIEVPFAQRRRMCNELGIQLGQKLEERIVCLDVFDRFSLLARWTIAANALDFRTVGTGYDFDMVELENSLHDLADRLDVDQLPQIYEKVRAAERILFVHDNVGEIALDKLLIEDMRKEDMRHETQDTRRKTQGSEISSLQSPVSSSKPQVRVAEFSRRVISAVRGGPITSDATMDDARQIRLHEAATSVILAGPDTLGISFEEMSEKLEEELRRADLIIAKGQANYYVFSEHKDEVNCPIVCLFRTKCQTVSGVFHAAENINIATIL